MKVEYIVVFNACKEAIWLKSFYNELTLIINHSYQEIISLVIDNAFALKLIKNPKFYKRTKYINIRHHFIREYIKRG